MSEEKNPFDSLPSFKETIARIAQVPGQYAPKPPPQFSYPVIDESNKITYKLISHRRLSPGEIRRALARAFSRTDAWPNEASEVEIRL